MIHNQQAQFTIYKLRTKFVSLEEQKWNKANNLFVEKQSKMSGEETEIELQTKDLAP